MFEIEFIKEMTREDGSKVDVTFVTRCESMYTMCKDVKTIVSSASHDNAWMKFKYIGPAR